jgi:hypothetical protein
VTNAGMRIRNIKETFLGEISIKFGKNSFKTLEIAIVKGSWLRPIKSEILIHHP